MCLAIGPQPSDPDEARTRSPSVSSQALYYWAPLFSMDVKQEINLKAFIFTQPHSFFLLLPYLKTQYNRPPDHYIVTLVQELGTHNGLGMNTAFWKTKAVTDIFVNILMVYFLSCKN